LIESIEAVGVLKGTIATEVAAYNIVTWLPPALDLIDASLGGAQTILDRHVPHTNKLSNDDDVIGKIRAGETITTKIPLRSCTDDDGDIFYLTEHEKNGLSMIGLQASGEEFGSPGRINMALREVLPTVDGDSATDDLNVRASDDGSLSCKQCSADASDNSLPACASVDGSLHMVGLRPEAVGAAIAGVHHVLLGNAVERISIENGATVKHLWPAAAMGLEQLLGRCTHPECDAYVRGYLMEGGLRWDGDAAVSLEAAVSELSDVIARLQRKEGGVQNIYKPQV
jgi:hypothetical protein